MQPDSLDAAPRDGRTGVPSPAGRSAADGARGAAAAVDLGAVTAGLLASPEWKREDRSSCSIVHTPALRVVVTALHKGATLHNDDPDESVTVQGVRGQAVVSIRGDGAILDEGTLVGVGAGVPWRLVATTDAVVVLTVGRTATRG
jgi:quercetin dioxygenase-like cupin family protein